MSQTDITGASDTSVQRYLEFAVPVASFGFTLVGIILWQAGIRLSFQYFAAGCLIGSCILAYLAWIRPRKDIVALSTPIYAIIFFVVPADYEAGVILQLLYAVSLTILLFRLKYRFGTIAPPSGGPEEPAPLRPYVERVCRLLPPVSPAIAHNAGSVFIRFAQGEYETVARLASASLQELMGTADEPVAAAFAIVAEQAGHTMTRTADPVVFRQFEEEQYTVLFHPEEKNADPGQAYSDALDNALLLLYAVARNDPSGNGNARLESFRQFAARLAEKE